jgi:hypothetical protein
MKKLTLNEFSSKKREFLLSYKTYEYNFDEMVEGFDIVRRSLSKPLPSGHPVSFYNAAVQLKQRAWDSLVFLTNCYSAGHSIEDLAKIYPVILEYWKSYGDKWIIFEKSDESSLNAVAAIPLLGTDFVFANKIICFAILFGIPNELNKMTSVIDFNNPRKDGMLERLLEPYVGDRGEPPDDCTRHLPYFKTLKIFSAPVELRAQLMAEYLDDWYDASRREPYYDSHKRGDQFTGYWAWEAAAITYILEINDKKYRNSKFYPADLVEFACSIGAPRSSEARPGDQELRVKSGQACPKSGTWEKLDIPLQRREFAAGEIMQAENSSYGITLWRYIGA